LRKAIKEGEFSWQLRTKEGNGYMKLILRELDKAQGYVHVSQMAKRIADRLHVDADQALRSRIRYRLNKLEIEGKLDTELRWEKRGFFPTKYYKVKESRN